MSKEKLHLVKKSKIHGNGVFANCFIKEGTQILEYLGDRIDAKEADERGLKYEEQADTTGGGSVYIFEVNDNLFIDGNFEYNDAKYINHSCETNCEAIQYDDEQIFIYATRDIQEGEELLYNYGYAFEHFLDHPCKCGSPNCCGYIVSVEDRLKLKKILRGRKKKS